MRLNRRDCRGGHGLLPARLRSHSEEIGNALYSTGPLALFVSANLLVVAAVALLAVRPTFWMLLVAIATYVLATVAVLGLAMSLLDE